MITPPKGHFGRYVPKVQKSFIMRLWMGPRAWILVMLPSHALQIGISAVDLSADGRNCIGSSCDDGSCEFCALGWASRCVKCEQTCAGHPCMRMAVKRSCGSDGSTDDLPSSAGLCSDCEAAAQLFALVKGNDEWCCRSDGKPYSPLDSEECLRTLQNGAWQVQKACAFTTRVRGHGSQL